MLSGTEHFIHTLKRQWKINGEEFESIHTEKDFDPQIQTGTTLLHDLQCRGQRERDDGGGHTISEEESESGLAAGHAEECPVRQRCVQGLCYTSEICNYGRQPCCYCALSLYASKES